MTRYVALLRGVNVGGNRKVPMPELRQVLESRGLADVTTYIQSGNVVFSAERRVSALDLQAAVADRFDIDVDVMLRTSSEFKAIVEGNPFPAVDTSFLHVGFMAKASGPAKALDADRFAPETAEVRGAEIYFYLPGGMGRSKLPAYLDRNLQTPTTIRNWKTTTKLLELAST